MADAFIRAFEQHQRNLIVNDNPEAADGTAVKLPKDAAESKIAHDNWDAYQRSRDSGHLDWVKMARKCSAYYSGDQWEKDIVDTLNSQNRPHLTINQVLSTVNSVTGEYIKSRQEISFRPRGKGANVKVAQALSFVMKQVQGNNKSRWVERSVLEDGIIEDRGYFDIRMDYSDNIMGEIREVARDPRDVLLDPGAKEYDPSTWNEVITTRWLTPDEIEAVYGKDKADKLRHRGFATRFGHDSIEYSFPTRTFGDEANPGGYIADSFEAHKKIQRVRVIERQHRVLTRVTYFVDPVEGDMREVPEGWDDEKIAEFAIEYDLDTLEKPGRRIRWTVSADDVLLEDHWSIYKNFTIIPFFPYYRRGKPTGMVRHLLSPQDMLNKISSQELHVVNTTANSGWIFESGSLVNMDADELEQVGAKTGLVLEFAKGSTPPQKIEANSVPTGLANISQKAQLYLRTVSGIPETFMGMASREISGVAVGEQNAAATTHLEVVFDNLEKARQYRAEAMLDLIQRFYTETRLIQVTELDMDGNEQTTEFNANEIEQVVDVQTGETVEERIINDLTMGEYDVVVASVPHAETMQDSIFAQSIEMRNAGILIPDWAIIENSRLPNRQEIADVVKKMQGMAEPTPEEVEFQMMQQQMALEEQQARVRDMLASAMMKEADAQLKLANAEGVGQELLLKAQEIGVKQRESLEAREAQLQTKIAELNTRIQIAREKNASQERSTQLETMSKRLQTALGSQVKLREIASRSRNSGDQ